MHVGSTWRRAIGVAGVAGALAWSTAGCGPDAAAVAEADRAAASATSRGGPDHDQIVLPADAYAFTTAELSRFSAARNLLIGQCLLGFGFTYGRGTDPVGRAQSADDQVADFGLYGNKRRYGVTLASVAGKYGYHLPSTVDSAGRPHRASPRRPTKAELVVMTGTDEKGNPVATTPSGKPIPRNGCVGKADATLGDVDGSLGDNTIVRSLAASSYQGSEKSKEVTTAFRAWSACMADRGHHYATPLSSSRFDISTKTVSAAEKATARDDVSCKQQTSLVTTWFGLEVTYQRGWIQHHASAFQKAKAERDSMLKKVDAVMRQAVPASIAPGAQ